MNICDFLLMELHLMTAAIQQQKHQLGMELRPNSVYIRDDVRLQKIAIEIGERRQCGESLASIARELNRRGDKGKYGGRWYPASVGAYLKKTCNSAQMPS